MPIYVALATWTDQGLRNVRDTVKHADVLVAAAEQAGCEVSDILWMAGPYDFIAIMEAPDDETTGAVSVAIEVQGNIRVRWVRGYRKEEMAKILAPHPRRPNGIER